MSATRFLVVISLLLSSGCCYCLRQPDGQLSRADQQAETIHALVSKAMSGPASNFKLQTSNSLIIQASAQEVTPPPRIQPPRTLRERLRLPDQLPGAKAPPIDLPPLDAPPAEKQKALERLYPPLPELGSEPPVQPGPAGRPLTLSDLQNLAMNNNPLIRQAAADVKAAQGAMIQAGTYPNPNLGYESDNVGTANTAGFQGAFFEQVIKTGGKLRLAQAAARMDLANAQAAFRRAQTDLATQVRLNYFAVLSAQENVNVNRALVELTDEAYRILVDQVRAAQAAPYEPLQLRAQAYQARSTFVQARNRFTAAWKQLATSLSMPEMPPTELAGKIDMALPIFKYDSLLPRILANHTDVRTAENSRQKARFNLRAAEVTPIPDVSVHVAVQKDYTAPPFNVCENVAIGVPIPIWDKNIGGIRQAQGVLARAIEESRRVQNDLTNRLATAFEQYENNRVLLEYYRDWIIPDQARAYRGTFERHQWQPDQVSFGDVVTAQQNLAASIGTYLTTLVSAWTSVVNVVDLLQVDDLSAVPSSGTLQPAPVPTLDRLPLMPNHCPAPDLPALPELSWPPAAPEEAPLAKPKPNHG
jgi:cobalt-zinc-cadmium efflux system outer membrane protein